MGSAGIECFESCLLLRKMRNSSKNKNFKPSKAAKSRPTHRVSEKSLLILALLGGSVAELLTMLKIRHKTKHKKFMIGLPVIIFLQGGLLWLILIPVFSS